MKLRLWLADRRIALVAWCRTRRAFRRHRLSPAAQQQLRDAARRAS